MFALHPCNTRQTRCGTMVLIRCFTPMISPFLVFSTQRRQYRLHLGHDFPCKPAFTQLLPQLRSPSYHSRILALRHAVFHGHGLLQRFDGNAHSLFDYEWCERRLVPYDHRLVGCKIQRQLMRIVDGQIFAVIAAAGVETVAVPDQTKSSFQFVWQFIGCDDSAVPRRFAVPPVIFRPVQIDVGFGESLGQPIHVFGFAWLRFPAISMP